MGANKVDQFINPYVRDRFYTAVGLRVADVRRKAGLSQIEVAKAADLAASTIDRVEDGTSCSVLVLTRIANAMDVLVDELIPLDAEQGPSS